MINSCNRIIAIFALGVLLTSCGDEPLETSIQYMPNMYEPLGYETYDEVDFLPRGTEAQIPADHTIMRGWLPYGIENTPEGKEQARLLNSPLVANDSVQKAESMANGSQLYTIYCAICHGDNGKGQGYLVEREKILGVPSYDDAARNITVGTTFHTIQYGLNSMGSYASQMDTKEMWQVSEYVMQLKSELTK